MTNPPKSIEALLAHKMRDVLLDWCVTRVPLDDPSRAKLVIIGKPTNELGNPPVISIHTPHPLGPPSDTDHMIVGTPRSNEERPYKWPMETMGGMRTDLLIGTVQINMREQQRAEDAVWSIGALATRVRNAINQDPRLRPFSDDMGNFMSRLETFQHSGHTGGGSNTTTHIRWVDFRAIIHSTNSRR